jgi:hypothetical protein
LGDSEAVFGDGFRIAYTPSPTRWAFSSVSAGPAGGTSVIEYEAVETIEARCAKDADRLECLMQAVEYGEAGYKRIDGWIESSRARIQTPFGRRLAEAALHTSPLAWRDR